MKKLLLLSVVACALVSVVFSQTVITKNVHALLVGENNPMSICSYADPGAEGADVTWDFSELEFKHSFTGYLNQSATTEHGPSFPDANVELSEFDSRFYFKISNDKIEQYGYSSASGNSKVHYSTPFVKIKYPFAYGDSYTGIYNGESFISGTKQSDITGWYSVEADAYGTLILPGNSIYNNTIRIRTEKSYVNEYSSISQDITIITYRWYSTTHRYPLLVLTEITTITGDREYLKTQAAYNNNAVISVENAFADNFSLYPNPVTTGELTLQFDAMIEGALHMEIFDLNGRLLKSKNLSVEQGSQQSYVLTDDIAGFEPASYVLVVTNGNDRISMNFTIVE